MRSNSPLHKTEPGAMAYEHSFDARVRDVSKPALAHRNDIHAEREGVIHLLFPDANTCAHSRSSRPMARASWRRPSTFPCQASDAGIANNMSDPLLLTD